MGGEEGVVTPGEMVGQSSQLIAGTGVYLAPNGRTLRASLTGLRKILPPTPGSSDQVASPSSTVLRVL